MTIGLLKPQPNEEGYKITSRDELRLTMVEYHGLDSEMLGVCRACGATSDKFDDPIVDPDANDDLCELCGQSAVTGVEELLNMGMVKFVDDGGEQAHEDRMELLGRPRTLRQ